MSSPSRAPYAEVVVEGHSVALLKDGLQTFPAMVEALQQAKSTICVETYILRDDPIARRVLDVLMERSRAGVEVNVMFDDWGSDVPESLFTELSLAGVRILRFGPVNAGPWAQLFARLGRRNHRKALTIDGEVGFLGGLNLSREYGALEDGGAGWRDTHVRLRGPAVLKLERLFLATWVKNKGAPIDHRRYKRLATIEHEPKVRVVGNDFRADRKDIRRAYEQAFAAATRRIWLTQAYFVPPARLLRRLTRAARRGVDVRVILGEATDVRVALLAARALYPRLLKAGVKVYEWQGRILHAKTGVVDGHWSTIGSTNLDALSLRRNLEVNAVIDDEPFAQALEKLFAEDLRHCTQVTLDAVAHRDVFERLVSWLVYRLRHWL